MAGCEELLQNIRPCMKIDNAFFLKIYGYEITHPGYADKAIKALNDAGCSRARQYYEKAVSDYNKRFNEELREVAHWYREECDRQWQQKAGEIKRKQERENLQQMSDSDLIILLENLIGAT